ncbi:Nucleolar complex protein 3 [Globisporangium polare]
MGNKRKQAGGGGGSAASASKGNKKAKHQNPGAPAAGKGRGKDSGGGRKNSSSSSSTNSSSRNSKPNAKNGKKGAAAKQQKQPEEEDVEVDAEDVEFFEENSTFSSFLMKMDPKQLSKSTHPKANKATKVVKPKKKDGDDDEEDMPLEKLEARPRKAGWENQKRIDLTSKLPVKFMDGSVRQNKSLIEDVQKEGDAKDAAAKEAAEAEDSDEEEDEEQGSDEEELGSDVSDMEFEEVADDVAPDAKDKAAKAKPQLSEVDLRIQREHRLAAKKIEIAQLCESILESPEDAFKKNKEHPKNFSKIQQLQFLCRDPDTTVKKLSMLSQLSVFLDILPDYRIRLTSDEKQNGRPLKKNVQKMQDFEASLLNNYQTFLKFCAQTVTEGLKGKNPTKELSVNDQRQLAMAETGARCLSELLKAKYAFNFHMNLIVALVPIADSHFANLRKLACSAFEDVFKSDKSSVYSYEIVKQISSYVKQKEHRVKQDIIRTFLVMPLDVTMEQGEDARKKAKNDRKKRRRLQNQGDTIASGLKEAEAVVDKSERQKTQADILHELVLVYFRILKQATYSTAMPAVLEGLSKYAFLINLDIMIDLLKVLKAVLREDILPLESALQAVLTGLRTLQGPGQELMVDEKEFVDILYKLLRKFTEGEDVSCFPTALLCVEAVFIRRKEIVVDRVAAFIKRLLLISIHLQPHQMLAVMSLIRSLFHRYSKLQQLLESDVDRVSSGEYRADVDDPDFTNPYSTALWELALLNRHYHPVVASFSVGTAEMGPSLPNEYPKAMLDNYNIEQTGVFNPKVLVPPRNPLHIKMALNNKKQANKRRQRERRFFVRDPSLDDGKKPSPFYQFCLDLDHKDDDETVNFQFKPATSA